MRYLLLSVLVVCMIGVMVPSVFAVNERTVTVQNAPGSSVPGCEKFNGCFIPNSTKLDPGDTVLWTNPDTVSHYVTSGRASDGPNGGFDSGIIMPGQTFSHQFTKTGLYYYFCSVHSWMEGKIIVKEGPDWTPQSSSPSVPTSKTSSKLILDPLPTTFNVKGSDSGADVTFSGLLVTAPQLSQPSAYIISGATITLKFTGFTFNGEDHYKITTDDNGKFNKKFTIPIGNDYGIRAVFEGADIGTEVLAPTKSQTEYFIVTPLSAQPPTTSIPLQETTATVTTEASSGQLYTELIKLLPNHIFQDTVTIPSPVPITLPVEGFVSGIKQTYIENTPGGGSEKPCKIFCSKPYRDKYTIDFWIFKFDSGVNALNFAKGLDRNDYGIHGGLQHVSSSSIESGLLQIEAPNLVTSCESTYWQNKERGTFWHNFIGTQGGKKTCVFANYVLSSNIQTEKITQEYNYHIGETYWLPNIIYPVITQIESSFIESGNTDIFKLTPNSKQIKEYGIYKITDAKIIHGSNDDLIVLNIKGNINWEIIVEHPERTDVRFRLYDNGLIPSWRTDVLATSWSSETLSESRKVTWEADTDFGNWSPTATTVKNPTFAFPNETCTKDVTVLAQEKGKPAETKLCFEVPKGMDSFVLAKVPEEAYPCSYKESSNGWYKLIGQCKNESVQKFAAFDREDIEGGTNIFSTKSTKGGGCLIATAAFGSEMAPQIQFLREIRDNTVLQTESGSAFMTGFNQFYYSFSPAIADYERENPAFKEAVKITLTPLLASLTLLQYADIDSESEMLGYGISIILLNIGMYFVAPAVLIMTVRKRI